MLQRDHMSHHDRLSAPLSARDIEHFVTDGFIKLEAAFPKLMADEGRTILWRDTLCDPHDPRTWTKPIVRLGFYDDPPFQAAANTPVLHTAFDQLVGRGRWQAPTGLGTFPVRFPSDEDPGDAGWHIDVSFGFDRPDFMEWRANWQSRGRSLLMLFLFSDVDESDAPTRIRIGSHRDIARQLAPAGSQGLTLRELAADGFAGSSHRVEALATGEAGDVYLCHPFLVHAAQMHRGRMPRFMAQPPLLPAQTFAIERDGCSPVEQAVRDSLRSRSG